MFSNIISQFNWVDIFLACVIGRAIFAGFSDGFFKEFLRLIGAGATSFLLLHYFSRLAGYLNKSVFVPKPFAGILSFLTLWATLFLIFKLIMNGFTIIFKAEVHPVFSRWGGLIVSLLQGLMVGSLVMLVFFISPVPYLGISVDRSFSGLTVANLAPRFYKACYDGLVVKYFPDEPFNKDALQITRLPENKTAKKK